ncbi:MULTISPECIES: hypothetical protein [Sphingomonadaceae]|jgi:hypothetical protein|uniref:Phosphoadenosine phosphosulphate reductase domain-containing protein n=5 Tax=Bacteria TaxID=2 RepID=A0A9J9HGP0_RHIWR|nr:MULTISPECIES: hypothetical protein [Sphingomonadaceae]ABQ71309.1 hypothetical protein Swit_5198 [Rhizorhabdus wittichii RW1]MBJ7439444.1 hypothetical protein [Sphingopyxis sp.]TNE44983.1 MAG: hypothetical protein EP345_02010 [Sphingomonadales bacterium]ASY46804.1 hypothetical protein CJD35_20140 [Sphingobium xenophagum]MDQ4422086.1 hypothetical protein [Sphingobium sp. DEHP117]|tara:strand:- start:296 stop:1264 length:969 start_codon:yes stop_codon:yes gene_type:complete
MLASDRPAPSARPRDIDYIRVAEPAPVVLAYGIGVDSTALLVELESRGTPPDLVITGDPGIEKPETYVYQEMMAAWMAARGIRYETVRYTPKRFKHWPPYYDLLANVLTNATLPSISLGRHSCSLKWKVAPQDAFLKQWEPAKAAWARGQKVIRLIGYDASPADTRRYNHASAIANDLFECRYPLREWGWNRAACIARIEAAGLPVPPKSSCFICGAMKPDEVRALPSWCLRLIVLVEARAAPRLRTVEGLWRRSTATRPGRMTDFIRAEELLPAADIDAIIRDAPADLIRFQDVAGHVPLPERPTMAEWLDMFNAGLLEAA